MGYVKKRIIQDCHYCGQDFECGRTDAKYCSPSHRVMACLKRKAEESLLRRQLDQKTFVDERAKRIVAENQVAERQKYEALLEEIKTDLEESEGKRMQEKLERREKEYTGVTNEI
jgi:hypothetical protein